MGLVEYFMFLLPDGKETAIPTHMRRKHLEMARCPCNAGMQDHPFSDRDGLRYAP
jgi:hypothetical protein